MKNILFYFIGNLANFRTDTYQFIDNEFSYLIREFTGCVNILSFNEQVLSKYFKIMANRTCAALMSFFPI